MSDREFMETFHRQKATLDQLKLKLVESNGNVVALRNELAREKSRAEKAEATLVRIANYAHDRSTGPTITDELWVIRSMALDSLKENDGE